MSVLRNPKRGEIYWVDFEPHRGIEQGGRRPGLVVQNDRGNRSAAYTTVAAITSTNQATNFPFIIQLDEAEGDLPVRSIVNCAQILTVDKSRLGDLIGSLSEQRMADVSGGLRYHLDLK
jgi:mRNA interferase MazF